MNARQREKEIAARRALALRKLAKVFGTNGGDAGAGAYTAERQILVEILRTTNEPDVVALVRDRLAVIAEGGASTPSDSDDDTTAPPADVSEVKSRFSSAWTLKALRDIAKGTRPVPSALATGAFWEDLVAAGAPELAHLRATGGSRDDSLVGDDVTDTAAAPTREPLWRGLDVEARRIREKLRRDGYAQCPRPEAFEDDPSRLARDPWTDALGGDTTLDDLADAMDALRVAGWPPVAVYAFDATWTVIDRLFEFAEAALGTRDVALEPSCFAWALRPAPASHRFESHRRSRATPRAPPTPWAPTFSSAPRLFRAGRVDDDVRRSTPSRRRRRTDPPVRLVSSHGRHVGHRMSARTPPTRGSNLGRSGPPGPPQTRRERAGRRRRVTILPRGEPSASGGGGIGLRVGGPDRALGRIVSPPRGRRHLRG